MKIILVGDWSRYTMDQVGGKLAKGEEGMPDGAEIISRWHDPGAKKVGIAVAASDAVSVQRWLPSVPTGWNSIHAW